MAISWKGLSAVHQNTFWQMKKIQIRAIASQLWLVSDISNEVVEEEDEELKGEWIEVVLEFSRRIWNKNGKCHLYSKDFEYDNQIASKESESESCSSGMKSR